MQLQRLLYEKVTSASNESRIAATHLKADACSAQKKNDELAEEVARVLLVRSKQLQANADDKGDGDCSQADTDTQHSTQSASNQKVLAPRQRSNKLKSGRIWKSGFWKPLMQSLPVLLSTFLIASH